MTAWKRSDALNGAHETRTNDRLAYKRVRNWENLGDEKSLMHVKGRYELASSLAWTPRERLSGDHCEAFGLLFYFPHDRSFGGLCW